jgi:hypothetical protein
MKLDDVKKIRIGLTLFIGSSYIFISFFLFVLQQ